MKIASYAIAVALLFAVGAPPILSNSTTDNVVLAGGKHIVGTPGPTPKPIGPTPRPIGPTPKPKPPSPR